MLLLAVWIVCHLLLAVRIVLLAVWIVLLAVWIVLLAVWIVLLAVWIVLLLIVLWIVCGCAVVSGCEQTGVPEAHFAHHWCQPSLAAAVHRVSGTA